MSANGRRGPLGATTVTGVGPARAADADAAAASGAEAAPNAGAGAAVDAALAAGDNALGAVAGVVQAIRQPNARSDAMPQWRVNGAVMIGSVRGSVAAWQAKTRPRAPSLISESA
jgi:hypothetical protein